MAGSGNGINGQVPQGTNQNNITYDGTGMPILGNVRDDMGDWVPPHLRDIHNQMRKSNGEAPRLDFGPDSLEDYNAANPENFQVMKDNNLRNAPPQGYAGGASAGYSRNPDGSAMGSAGGVTPRGGPQQIRQPMQQPQGFNVNQAAAQGIQQAQQGASNEMGYRPMAIGAPSQANLQQYTNPYESQVVQQSLGDLERSRLMTQNAGDAQAGAANAFGGSRHGIAAAETNRGFADQAARTASGLRMGGYQNAQDMARQASMANQQAGFQGSQQRLNAGSQLGNLSNLGFGMGQTIQGNMDRQGLQQQAMNQQLINDAKGQYAGYTGAPANSLQYLLQAVGGAPNVGSTEKGYSPGLFDYLTLAGTTYAGIN